MYNNKLIQTILGFSEDERRHFKRFINADFVNKNSDIKKLSEYIFSRRKLTVNTTKKENAHDYIYPGKPYNDLRIRHLIWMTNEILEQFITQRQMYENEKLRVQLCMDFYIHKELFQYADTCVAELIKSEAQLPHGNAQHYLRLYQTYSTHYIIQSKNNRNQDYKVQEVVDNLSVFSIAELLKNACIAISLKNILETGVEQPLLEWILPRLYKSKFWSVPIIRIYYQLFLLLKDNDEAIFLKLEYDIKENESLFPKPELRELYIMLINFCVRLSNRNIQEYTQKAFDLYLSTIEKGYLIEHNELSRFTFTNVITLGIKLKEFARAEFFIELGNTYINSFYRKNTIEYNQAKILYAKGKHKRALTILLTNEFKDTLWNLNAKFITLRILFEMKDYKTLRKQLQLFNVFISRKKNIGYHRDYFTKVVASFKQLLEMLKHPEQYKMFRFDEGTPEMNWFNEQVKTILP